MAWGAGAAVIAREAVRSSRRWQTYGLRFAFATLLFILVIAAWTEQIHTIMTDPAAAARMGHGLFVLYTSAQLFLVSVVAPVVVGQAIAEEREDGTLELLTLTRLSAAQILWAKLSSRLMIMASLVCGTLPVLALTLTFGGIGVWQAVNAVSVTLLMLVLLGAVGGFAALTSRGGIAGLISAVGYTICVVSLAPLMLFAGHAVFTGRGARPEPWLAPWQAFDATEPIALAVWLVYLPAIVGLGLAAAPVFRMATADDPEDEGFGALSPDIWKVERFKRLTGAVLVGWVVLTLVFGLTSKLVPEPVWTLWKLTQASGLTFVLTVVWVFAFQTVSRILAGLMRSRSYEIDPEYASAAQRRWLALRKRVWDNPVLWRELVTQGQGPGTLFGRYAAPLMLAVSVPLLLFAEFDDDMWVLIGMGGFVSAWIATGLAAAGSMVPERRARTLELLATTTMSPTRIIAGKLTAIAAHSLPLFLLSLGYIFAGLFEPWDIYETADTYCHYGAPSHSTTAMVKLKAGLLAMWAVPAWASVALAALLASARVRPANLGWGVGLAVALGWLIVPVLAMISVFQRGAEPLARIWMPLASRTWRNAQCAAQPEWVLSTGLHLALAVGMLAVLRWRWRHWVA